MHAVIFEVELKLDGKDEYLEIAAQLKALLSTIDGFISIERFQSLSNEGKVLSLSFWRDEEAIGAWRNLTLHREAQQKGSQNLFNDYRIRVAEVSRDYSLNDRAQAPKENI